MDKLLVISQRAYEHWPSYDLIYEWEDELIRQNPQLRLYKEHEILYRDKHLFRFMEKKLHINPNQWLTCQHKCFHFDMNPRLTDSYMNTENHSVCIIDFYLREGQLNAFYKSYKKVDRVFVSSREIYDFLLRNNPEREVLHMPLTLPDKYRLNPNTHMEKTFDLVLIGRQNSVLLAWLKEYEKNHSITYVYRGKISAGKFPYYTNHGEYVGNILSRKDYFDLMKKSKIAFYATPGMDEGENRTNGFSQVTPRFLEELSCGCNVISRFRENSDTDYFELNKMSTRVESYKGFVTAMQRALETAPDLEKYARYLEKHYTSTLADNF